MHELFLCDLILEENFQQVMRMFQGYCGMSPVTVVRRDQFWEGPRNRNAIKSLDLNLVAKQHPEKVKQWRALNDALARQAYVVTLSYDVKKSHFGEAEGKDESEIIPIEFDKLPGTLRWTDVPDSTSAGSLTNGRACVEILLERGLHTILKSMNHRFTREVIKDGYRFVHGNVLIEFYRMIVLHPEGEISNLGNPLPPLSSLELFDSANKWCLVASVKIDAGIERTEASQKLNREATNELLAIKAAFDGSIIDLRVTDRLSFDTRVKN